MWNRISKTLTLAELQSLTDAVAQLKTDLSFTKALTADERRRGGWNATDKAKLLMTNTLSTAKQFTSTTFPNLDVAEFEADLILLNQLEKLDHQLIALRYSVGDTLKVLRKDLSEQSRYTYSIVKIMHKMGVGDAGYAYDRLSEFMPGKGKRKPKGARKKKGE